MAGDSKNAIARVRARAEGLGRQRVEVPEWGDESGPLVIWFSMVTLGDLAAAAEVSKGDPMRQYAEVICLKATDETGAPLFKRIDALALMEAAEPKVILRIAKAMGLLEPIGAADGDAAKN